MVEIISILNSVKSFLICRKNTKKYDGNDMAIDVAQREHNNIKCYVSAFSNNIDLGLTYCLLDAVQNSKRISKKTQEQKNRNSPRNQHIDLLGINTKQEKTKPRNQHQTIKGERPTITRLGGGNGMEWKGMKKIILEYSFILLFGSSNGGNGGMESSFPCLRV